MGWTGYYREPGESDRAHIGREVLGDRYRITECATVRNTFYALCEPTGDTGEAFALVVLQQRDNRNNRNNKRTRCFPGQDMNYWRKELEESMGPVEAACPARVLDAIEERIPVPPNDYAAEWRQRCRANLAKVAEAARIKPGAVVRFDRELSFGDWGTHRELRFAGRSRFVDPRYVDPKSAPVVFCVPAWRTRIGWELVAA